MKIRLLIVAVCATTTIAQTAFAAPVKPVCEQLIKQLDTYDKQQASGEAGGIGDNSAPRETNRLLRVLILTQNRQTTITLMGQNGCAPVGSADRSIDYFSAAISCETAKIKGDRNPPECDTNMWTRSGKQ